MIELYLNPVTQPEGFFYELLCVYGFQKKDIDSSISFSNNICDGCLALLRLKSKNIAIFSHFYYNKDIRYYITCQFKDIWGQLRLFRTEQNDFFFTFDIVRNNKVLSALPSSFLLQKSSDTRIWSQEAGSRTQLLAIYVSEKYLLENWGWDDSSSRTSNNSLLLNDDSQFTAVKDNHCLELLTKVFSTLLQEKQGAFFVEQIEDITDKVIGTYVFANKSMKYNVENSLIQAEAALIKDFKSPPTLDELSRIVGMNSIKFQKLFTEYYGCTFYQYYQKKRFAYAKKLIETMGYSASEAAYAIGYKHLGHFSKEFAKINGVKPSELKKTH